MMFPAFRFDKPFNAAEGNFAVTFAPLSPAW
jgi:hypothetical protein